MGADLDLDELERLIAAASPRPWRIEPLLRDYLAGAVDGENRNVADMRRADAWLVVALANAAPALIAAARAAKSLRACVGRLETAELVALAEVDELRALCREAAEYIDPMGWEHGTEEERALVQRLRAAGGGT